jgi:hypothetical protein
VNRLKQNGQSAVEYGIALALVVVLAIGALSMMGKNIQDLLGYANASIQDKVSKPLAQNAAMRGANGKTGGPTGSGQALAGTGGVNLSVDSATGEVMINGVPLSDKNATSVDGGTLIKAMADQLGALSNWHSSSGEPLPPDAAALLQKLKASGQDMSVLAKNYEDPQAMAQLQQLQSVMAQQMRNGQYTGQPVYPDSVVNSMVHYGDQYAAFSQTYQQLDAVLDRLPPDSPDTVALKQQISAYGTTLQNMVHQGIGTFFNDFHMTRVPPASLQAAMQNNPNAAGFFSQINAATAGLPDSAKDQYFQVAATNLGNQMLVKPMQ